MADILVPNLDHLKQAYAVTSTATQVTPLLESMGGRYLIPVAAERRDAAGVKAGDRLTVDISLDSVPREVEVPKYIADAFKKAGVLPAFDKLSYSHRKEHVRAIEDAKTEATRERRIATAIEKLQS